MCVECRFQKILGVFFFHFTQLFTVIYSLDNDCSLLGYRISNNTHTYTYILTQKERKKKTNEYINRAQLVCAVFGFQFSFFVVFFG